MERFLKMLGRNCGSLNGMADVRLFGVEIGNIPIINVQQELDLYRVLIRDEEFLVKLGMVGEPIDIGQLEWRGLPMHLLTYMVQRGILAVEASVDAAVDYQAAIEKHHDAAFAKKRAAIWNGGGSANTYYNKLPGLLNPRYMLCNSDRDLWATTKRFYSEIRNPLFHGYELSSPRPNSVSEILDYLAAMMHWIETWCVWSGRHLSGEGRRRAEPDDIPRLAT